MAKTTEAPKWMVYATQIQRALQETIFNPENDHYIGDDVLYGGDDITELVHALANVVPTNVVNTLTRGDESYITMNHKANVLCFQYANREEDEQKGEEDDK